MNKTKTTYFIITQAILFVLFLLITSWFNRYAADDYFFIGELNSKSFKEVYHYLYYDWHGRWSSNFLFLSFLELRSIPYFLFIYFIFTYSFLLLGIYYFLKQINIKYNLILSNAQLILYAIIGMGVFFFCTVNANETWFWYISSGVYFWSIIAFIYLIAIYLSPNKNSFKYLIYTIPIIFIGGSNEPLTAFLGLFFVYQIIKSKNKAINYISLIILICSFSINYLSPGTLNRDEITPSLDIINWILYIGYGSIKYLIFTSYKTFVPAILFAVPFYYLGKKNKTKSVGFNIKQQLLFSLIGIIILVVINQTIVITALGGLSPDRAQISASLFIAFIIIRYAFLWGNSHQKSIVKNNIILLFNIITLLIFNIYFFSLHQTFSKKYDERIAKIIASDKEIIEVTALPFSGYIYHSELKKDSGYFVNQHLKSGLGIKSELVLAE